MDQQSVGSHHSKTSQALQQSNKVVNGSQYAPTTNKHNTERSQNHQHAHHKEDHEKDILFKDLDITSISFKPYFLFFVAYLFNAVLVLPAFLVKMVIFFGKDIFNCIVSCKMMKLVKTIIYYTIDIMMAFSVLMMYPLAFIPTPKPNPVNFQFWAISCLIFLQSYILLQSYMQTIVKDLQVLKVSELLSEENTIRLGLGRLVSTIHTRSKGKGELLGHLHQELHETINQSLDEENIDPTLFFFTLETDQGLVTIEELQEITREKVSEFIARAKDKIQEEPKQSGVLSQEGDKRNQVVRLIRTQGFRGKRHIIDNLLWPHFQYIKLMQHFSTIKLVVIIIFVLMLKGAYPVYAIVLDEKGINPTKQFLILGVFVGMYLNMISILIGLVINDDLKGKRYILNVLETMIMQNKEIEDEDDDRDDDLPFNNKYKLDLSCNLRQYFVDFIDFLSLESWDNARRLTIILDKDKQDMYETTFSFLAIYLLYTYIILSQDFLGFDLFPSLHKFFNSPIQEWNMLIDFLLITLLFLVRVNQGSMYNESFHVCLNQFVLKEFIFQKLQETINKIASVYEDKKSLFDFYFSSSILYNIQNETYRNITHRIFCTAAEKVLYALAQKNIREISPTKFRQLVSDQSKQRVLQLCATMEKLVSQIEFDSEHFCHRFLGLFKSDIAKTFSTFLLLAYIFFHSKIKHYLKEHKKKGS